MENSRNFEDLVLTRKAPPSLRKAKKAVIYGLLVFIAIVVSIFFAFPFIYMILMSLMKDSQSIFLYPQKIPRVLSAKIRRTTGSLFPKMLKKLFSCDKVIAGLIC